MTRKRQGAEIVWRCDVCANPIRDDDGYLCVSYPELFEHKKAVREWDEAHAGQFAITADEFLTFPSPVRWRVLHRGCDPDLESSAYWIAVERIGTPGAVVRWTAHLLESKGWLQSTTWADLLREVGGPGL